GGVVEEPASDGEGAAAGNRIPAVGYIDVAVVGIVEGGVRTRLPPGGLRQSRGHRGQQQCHDGGHERDDSWKSEAHCSTPSDNEIDRSQAYCEPVSNSPEKYATIESWIGKQSGWDRTTITARPMDRRFGSWSRCAAQAWSTARC